MAISNPTSVAASATVSSGTTLSSANFTPTAGDLLIVPIGSVSSNLTTISLASSWGLTWTIIDAGAAKGGLGVYLDSAIAVSSAVPSSPAAGTITITFSASLSVGAIAEFYTVSGASGVGTSGVLQTQSASPASVTLAAAPAATSLLFGSTMVRANSGAFTWPTGWTSFTSVADSSGDYEQGGYINGSASQTNSWSISGSPNWAASVVEITASGGTTVNGTLDFTGGTPTNTIFGTVIVEGTLDLAGGSAVNTLNTVEGTLDLAGAAPTNTLSGAGTISGTLALTGGNPHVVLSGIGTARGVFDLAASAPTLYLDQGFPSEICQLQLLIANPSGGNYPSSYPDGSSTRFVTQANGITYCDFTPYFDYSATTNQTTITAAWGRQGSTASIAVADYHPGGKLSFVIESMADIQVNLPLTGSFPNGYPALAFQQGAGWYQNIFAGKVNHPQMYMQSVNLAEWYVDSIDYTIFSNCYVINTAYSGITMDNAIVDLINASTHQTGLTASRVQDGGYVALGPLLPFVSLPFQTLTQAIQTITQQSSLSANYGWFFDQNKELHWFNQFQGPTPTTLITDRFGYGFPNVRFPGGDPRSQPSKGALTNPYPFLAHIELSSQFYYEWDGTQLYNDVQVAGSQIQQPYNIQGPPAAWWTANGFTPDFPLPFPVLTEDTSATYIGIQALVEVNGQPEEVGLQVAEQSNNPGLPGLNSSSGSVTTVSVNGQTQTVPYLSTPWVFYQTNNGQWFLHSNKGVPAAGTSIMCWYAYQIDMVGEAVDQTSIQQYGRFSEIINDNSLITQTDCWFRAYADLQEYRHIQERLNCYTTEDLIGHINIGDTIFVDIAEIPDSQNQYHIGISTSSHALDDGGIYDAFLVTQLTINILNTGQRQYQIQALRISTS